jgi:hypothetical protein
MSELLWVLVAIAVLLLPAYLLYRRFRADGEAVAGGSDLEQIFGPDAPTSARPEPRSSRPE